MRAMHSILSAIFSNGKDTACQIKLKLYTLPTNWLILIYSQRAHLRRVLQTAAKDMSAQLKREKPAENKNSMLRGKCCCNLAISGGATNDPRPPHICDNAYITSCDLVPFRCFTMFGMLESTIPNIPPYIYIYIYGVFVCVKFKIQACHENRQCKQSYPI